MAAPAGAGTTVICADGPFLHLRPPLPFEQDPDGRAK